MSAARSSSACSRRRLNDAAGLTGLARGSNPRWSTTCAHTANDASDAAGAGRFPARRGRRAARLRDRCRGGVAERHGAFDPGSSRSDRLAGVALGGHRRELRGPPGAALLPPHAGRSREGPGSLGRDPFQELAGAAASAPPSIPSPSPCRAVRCATATVASSPANSRRCRWVTGRHTCGTWEGVRRRRSGGQPARAPPPRARSGVFPRPGLPAPPGAQVGGRLHRGRAPLSPLPALRRRSARFLERPQ